MRDAARKREAEQRRREAEERFEASKRRDEERRRRKHRIWKRRSSKSWSGVGRKRCSATAHSNSIGTAASACIDAPIPALLCTNHHSTPLESTNL